MTEPMTTPAANQEQIELWNTEIGRKWTENADHMDRMLAPVNASLVSLVAAKPGERVLDIGCGCGVTSLTIAEQVGAQGKVLGVDVSEPMLAVARQRSLDAGLTQCHWKLADAASYSFEPSFDAIVSRFGVMFFDDPHAAFRNIRQAAAPGARLIFACWRPASDNPWLSLSVATILPLLPPQPPVDPLAPGPFAFADATRVTEILTQAGFEDVQLSPFDCQLQMVEQGGAAAAVAFATEVGPAARLLADAEPSVVEAAKSRLHALFQTYEAGGVVAMDAAIWMVTARAG